MQSYIFDFKKSPTFFQKWNKEFDVEEIETTCFYLVLADAHCDDNISDVLNSDGQIQYSDDYLLKKQCSLTYTDDNVRTSTISLDGDVEFELESDFQMKGAFLTTDAGYVLGYSINTFALNIVDSITFEDGLHFWDLVESVSNGE